MSPIKGATEETVLRARLEVAEMMLRHIANPYDVRNQDPNYSMALRSMTQITLVQPGT